MPKGQTMRPMFLTDEVKITKVADQAGAATTTVTSSTVDMAADGGWDGVCFLSSFGTAAANNTLKAQQSSDDGDADAYADVEESAVDVGASDEDVILDILHPTERYLKCLALRGTSTTSGDIWAIQYRGRKRPSPDVTAGTAALKQISNRPEGTA